MCNKAPVSLPMNRSRLQSGAKTTLNLHKILIIFPLLTANANDRDNQALVTHSVVKQKTTV